MLHQDEENDLGLARAFRRPRAEIGALLINAGIGKETSLGFGIQKKVFLISQHLWKAHSKSEIEEEYFMSPMVYII